MSGIDEISKSIGSLEANVRSLMGAVEALSDKVDGLQKSKWTTKGIMAGLALGGGAFGSKLAEILGMTGTPPNH
jgi:hypothetical protein